jgi:ElaB/YqjD/DUF883 family membrane-anchored ribosome-binding protein
VYSRSDGLGTAAVMAGYSGGVGNFLGHPTSGDASAVDPVPCQPRGARRRIPTAVQGGGHRFRNTNSRQVRGLEDIMATMTESAAKVVRNYAEPAMAAVEENVRDLRRAVAAGRHAAEDYAAETTKQVRRHPFAALGVAVGFGAVFGCLIGFGAGWFGGRRAA